MRSAAALAVLVATGAAATVAPAAGGATEECNGLPVCVRVAGPWVVVPTAEATARPQTTFVLSCPKRFIVGGLDAELSDPDLDVSFDARLGSPVNPGVSTSRDAIFRATKTRPAATRESFRPHLGCVPAAGGTGPKPRTILTHGAAPVAAVYPPGRPTAPHVRTLAVRRGVSQRVAIGCPAGTRLVASSRAVAFVQAHAPSAPLAAAVSTSLAVTGNRAVASVRNALPAGAHALVQVVAFCTGAVG